MWLPLATSIFIFLCFGGTILIESSTVCPSGWTFSVNNSFCYKISETLMQMEEAINYCESIGGKLAYIKVLNEKSFLIDYTKNEMAQPWLGLRRNLTNNNFYTIDGAMVFSTYWAAGEPGLNGNCATFRALNSNGMIVTRCDQLQPALCKQSPAICPNNSNYGGLYTRSGTIKSPGYPDQYYNNLDCIYTITSPNNTFITINFDPYLVENNFDKIKIYDGSNQTSANYLGGINYDYDKKTFESTSNVLSFIFHTDATIIKKGWLATWTAKSAAQPIYQSGDNGTLTSPNYPNYYDSYTEQLYFISVPYGFQINMTIDDFTTENRFDPLLIYNSSIISNNSLIANLSGNSIAPWNWLSSSNQVSLKFTSDGSVQKKGWHLTWQIA